MKKIIIFLIIFMHTAHARTVFIIIHGTWASGTAWCKPGGDFFTAIEKKIQDAAIISYTWSGSFSPEIRLRAALGLAKLIQSYPSTTHFIIIGHSHGGNVAMLASHMLTSSHQIERLYLLGTPINKYEYLPNMDAISHVYNLFSFGDDVQCMAGIFERAVPNHEHVHNIHVAINGKAPGHSELHTPCIAQWIAQHGESPAQKTHLSFINNNYVWKPEPQQHKLLENEKLAIQKLMFDFSKEMMLKKTKVMIYLET